MSGDHMKDVTDNDVDSLCRVFHTLKIEPCRLRLVSMTPVIRGKNEIVFTMVAKFDREFNSASACEAIRNTDATILLLFP